MGWKLFLNIFPNVSFQLQTLIKRIYEFWMPHHKNVLFVISENQLIFCCHFLLFLKQCIVSHFFICVNRWKVLSAWDLYRYMCVCMAVWRMTRNLPPKLSQTFCCLDLWKNINLCIEYCEEWAQLAVYSINFTRSTAFLS